MSLAAQEQALFDLLFDSGLRRRFADGSVAALTGYDLSDAERADFLTVRTDALALDARLRAEFVLSHLCRAFPLSFTLAASLPAGVAPLRDLVDTRVMRAPPVDRPVRFGERLRETLAAAALPAGERDGVLAIVDAELGMAMTAASVRRAVMSRSAPPGEPGPPAPGWQQRPLVLAPFVSAAVLPASYAHIKTALCPCADSELWGRLAAAPPAPGLRARAFAKAAARVLLARARVRRPSACDIDVDHATLELSDGFAPLLGHVDGNTSTTALLAQMRAVGAPEALLPGIEAGFRQLLETGMVITV
jgi:hypothetical protein